MITKNGSILWGKGRMGGYSINNSDMIDFYGNANGDLVNQQIDDASTSLKYGNFLLTYGSGTTPPTKNDYTIDEIRNARIYKTDMLKDLDAYGNMIFTRAGTNITNEPITVTELALYYNYNNIIFVVARDLIEPRVVQPGETVTFSMKIGF